MTQEDIMKLREDMVKLRKDVMKLCIVAIMLLVVITVLIASPFLNVSNIGSMVEAANNAAAVD